MISVMGQQESSYRKFDGSSRRLKKKTHIKAVSNVDEKVDAVNTDPEASAERKQFRMPSFGWRSGSSTITSLTTLSDKKLPGWFHGWTNRAQVEYLNPNI